MLSTQVVRIHQKSLEALAAHYIDTCMDDSEFIRIVRVLVSAAVSVLLEDQESDSTIADVESGLRQHAKDFYVANCARNCPDISNKTEYMDECAEMFDYIYLHGRYPDE